MANDNASSFYQVNKWIELVKASHDEDAEALWDSLLFDGGMDDYDDIPPFTWESGDHDTNILAIFNYLRATHGDRACFKAFIEDAWDDLSHLQAHGPTMGKMVWRYNYVYCCKIETIMSVLRKFYILDD